MHTALSVKPAAGLERSLQSGVDIEAEMLERGVKLLLFWI